MSYGVAGGDWSCKSTNFDAQFVTLWQKGSNDESGLTITHPYRLMCRYSFAKSSMAEAGVESLTFQDGLCAAWRPVSVNVK